MSIVVHTLPFSMATEAVEVVHVMATVVAAAAAVVVAMREQQCQQQDQRHQQCQRML
jgi:hypothetical protein